MEPLVTMFRLEGNPDYSEYVKTNPIVDIAYDYIVTPLKSQ